MRKYRRLRVRGGFIPAAGLARTAIKQAPAYMTGLATKYRTLRTNPVLAPYIQRAERAAINSATGLARRVLTPTKMRSASKVAVGLTSVMKSSHTATQGEVSRSYYTFGRYNPPYFRKAVSNSAKFVRDVKQGVYSGQSSGTGTQIVNDIQWLDSESLFQIGNELVGVFPADTYSNKFWIGENITNIRFSNPTNITLNVTLYDYETRRDCTTMMFNIDESTAPPSLATAWNWSAGLENLQGYNPTKLGTTPFEVQLAGVYFSIRKVTTISLTPGSEHVHRVTRNINKLFRTEMVNALHINNEGAMLSGFSGGTMIVTSGTIVQDSQNPELVDTGAPSLCYVWNTSNRVYTYNGQSQQVEYLNTTPTLTAPTLVTINTPKREAQTTTPT